MNLSRIYSIYIRQWFLIKGNPIRLINTFLWLLIEIIQWGFISKYIGTFGLASFNFVTVILGAIILWEFMSRLQQGIMTAFLEDIWSQNFINFFASPLTIKEYLAGLITSSIMTTTVGLLLVPIITGLFFNYNVFKIGLMIVPLLIVLFIFGVAVGIFICTLILRYGPTAEWVAWPIPFLLSIIACVFYPLTTLPGFLQVVAHLTPAVYVFESLRQVVSGGPINAVLWHNLFIGLVLALAYLAVSYWFFIRIYRRNLKTGGISRFSAQF